MGEIIALQIDEDHMPIIRKALEYTYGTLKSRNKVLVAAVNDYTRMVSRGYLSEDDSKVETSKYEEEMKANDECMETVSELLNSIGY